MIFTRRIPSRHWRDQLQYHRARLYRWQQERNVLVELLARKRMSPAMRARLETSLQELSEQLEPPVFNRPRQSRPETP